MPTDFPYTLANLDRGIPDGKSRQGDSRSERARPGESFGWTNLLAARMVTQGSLLRGGGSARGGQLFSVKLLVSCTLMYTGASAKESFLGGFFVGGPRHNSHVSGATPRVIMVLPDGLGSFVCGSFSGQGQVNIPPRPD